MFCSLAQDFQKPFDAPAILVVGHQTDGKSALVEALMGFQYVAPNSTPSLAGPSPIGCTRKLQKCESQMKYAKQITQGLLEQRILDCCE
jgi:hypothetical protein